MLQSQDLVRLSQEGVEQSDDGTLEFSVLLGLDGNRGETLPQDDLANVSSDE